MFNAAQMLKHLPPELRENLKSRADTAPTYSPERDAEKLNELSGDLTGYDCPDCKNKGVVYFVKNGCVVSRDCDCMQVRRSREMLKKSGLEGVMKEYRFDRYETAEPWQKEFRDGALRYLKDHDRKWFFAGGQPGVGKTHICTALAAQFLRQGIPVRYMLWKEDCARLKAVVTDSEAYSRLMEPLKTVAVLYIDDFFKPSRDESGQKRPPTAGDINIAFDILNYRYVNNLPTIISTERTIDELLDIDEAIGSRIYQRTKGYCFSFLEDRSHNYRLRK